MRRTVRGVIRPGRALPALLLAAGCVPPSMQQGDVRMVDPRTGIAAVCPAGRPSIDPGRSDLANCIAELRHYGFGIEQELIAAHEPPAGAPAAPATTAARSPFAATPLPTPPRTASAAYAAPAYAPAAYSPPAYPPTGRTTVGSATAGSASLGSASSAYAPAASSASTAYDNDPAPSHPWYTPDTAATRR